MINKLSVLYFLLTAVLPGADNVEVVKQTNNLLKLTTSAEKQVALEAEETLIKIMYTVPIDSAKVLSPLYIDYATRTGNASFLIKSLVHSYRLYPPEKSIPMLTRACIVAEQTGNYYMLAAAYMFKGIVYRDNYHTDSAMIYALKALATNSHYGNPNDKGAMLQLIADMYYAVGEYENAENYYTEVIKTQEKTPDPRAFVNLQNNIALIRIQQKKYEEADSLLQASVLLLRENGFSFNDFMSLTYLYRKLMETNLLKQQFAAAKEYYYRGIVLSLFLKTESEYAGYYIGYATILRHAGKPDSALYYLKTAEAIINHIPDIKYKLDFLREMSEAYKLLGNYEQANKYLEELVVADKSADSLNNRSKIKYLHAEHNFNESQRRLFAAERENILLLLMIILAVLLAVVLFYGYIKLRKAYKVLIEKSIEQAYQSGPIPVLNVVEKEGEVQEDPQEIIAPESILNSDEEEMIDKLIVQLELLFEEEKIYLNSELSINDVAKQMKTNRTYLSRAINKKYNTNFLHLLNGHRVKESIRLMSSPAGKTLTLEAIAESSGFNNRVTFARAFKQHTSVAPGYFYKNITTKANTNQ